jgi:DNA-binding NtrC family response regulator
MSKISLNIPEYDLQTPTLIYESEQIKKVMALAKKVANDPECRIITIVGEPGVMKSEVARWIAIKCNRKGKTVEIDCEILPETLIEAELFGRRKGAHNDANETRIGLVARASEGVCIFDDINFIPVSHQHKLACFIEHGRFRQVGCDTIRSIDVKIIATTNIPWERAVRDNQIQKDLYNRLNNFRIQIPPLRDRKEDILVLANYFLEQKAGKMKIENIKFSPKVKECFVNYYWPNNVRELKQTVEGSIIRCDKNTILLEHLPEDVVEGSNRIPDELQDSSAVYLDGELKDFIFFVKGLDDPLIYRRDYESLKGVSKASANRKLNRMVESGVLKKKGQGRATFYAISPRRLSELSKHL